MDRWTGRVALVTGASVGIGASIAQKLVEGGMKVIGVARNFQAIADAAKKLEGAKGQLIPMKCDVTKEEDILKVFANIRKNYGGVDVLINNAGLAHDAPLLDPSSKTSDWKNMLDVNVLGIAICSREAYKSMKERGIDDGHIFNIGSMSGHRVIPSSKGHFYSATKFAVKAMTEGTRQELREAKSHIRVTHVSPGVVETEFAYRFTGPDSQTYKNLMALQAEDISSSVIHALTAPAHVEINDILIRPTEQSS
ncbi:DgyrCDS13251 [Dimorphilus gyrociliatus]|uniref:DgyrCDS13251 n=1 Tax=Dimorphilus gyrociliatus TaxID=2664684 RepID=A0A7I8WA44_9ANNE|nr:DgyrCDS13251 [Dimorphilus gyrociliatus]